MSRPSIESTKLALGVNCELVVDEYGCTSTGPHAADLLAPVAMALQLNAIVDDLAVPGGANPTLSELAFMAAQACKK